MKLTDYQRGILDLHNLLRKYGTILYGEIGIKTVYHSFLKKNNLPIRRSNKKQKETLDYLRYYLPPQGKTKTRAGSSSITVNLAEGSEELLK